MIQAHAESNTGPVRTVNEDSWLIQGELGLFAVADGMGGHNAGEVASRLALDALSGFIGRSASDSDLSWPYGVDPELSFQANRLRTGIHLANRRVFRAAESRDDYTGMGTTLVSVLVHEKRVIVGHVGDSRVYRLTDGELSPVTQDDSWAAALRSQGLTPRRARASSDAPRADECRRRARSGQRPHLRVSARGRRRVPAVLRRPVRAARRRRHQANPLGRRGSVDAPRPASCARRSRRAPATT